MYAEQLCCIRVVALREAGQSVNRRSVHVVLETFDIESLRAWHVPSKLLIRSFRKYLSEGINCYLIG